MMRLRFVVVFFLAACSPAAPAPTTAQAPPSATAAEAPSADPSTAPSVTPARTAPAAAYDEAFSAMEKRARETRDGGGCFVAEYGTCGNLRYIEEMPGGLIGTVRYFDEKGALVATQHSNIDSTAGARGPRWDGPPQTCGRKKIRDLCKK
jgi:hypothetical protein